MSKKQKLTIGGTLALIVLLAYSVFSYQAWAGVGELRSQLQNDLSTTKSDFSTSENDETTQLKQRQTIDRLASSQAHGCQISWLYKWQKNIIPGLSSSMTDCEDNLSQVNKLRDKISTLQKFLTDEDKIANILGNVAPAKDPISEDKWQTELKKTQKIKDQLAALKTSEEAKSVKQASSDSLQNVIDAWSLLIDAKAEKSSEKYDEASAKLTQAYASFAIVTDTSDKIHAEISRSIRYT